MWIVLWNSVFLHIGILIFTELHLQGGAKLMELSLVTHVPSGPIGYAWAGHFVWQK